jgi:serine/threonine protein kinase/WD40 repeat protein
MSPDIVPTVHPPPEQLWAFNLGRLSDEEAALIGTHLDGCPACCALLRELPVGDAFVSRVRAAADTRSATASQLGARPPQRLGDYTLVREIGRGGMGVVYEAEQRSLGRRVALKVLSLRGPTNPATLARFRREARLAARLHHTHIVPVFEVGQEGDTCFFAMQFIPGQSLDRVLKWLRGPRIAPGQEGTGTTAVQLDRVASSLAEGLKTPISCPGVAAAPDSSPPVPVTGGLGELRERPAYFDGVARVGLHVAEALAYAHARGVLHRDIKPSNLLLDEAGSVWVADFGLAKGEDDGLTGTGDFLGTLRYMAPERFKGLCDARADIYALGLTLYELLTGRPAFDATDQAQLISHICAHDPARPRALCPSVPHDLETVVLKGMDRDPDRRYQTAAELADDLGRFLDRLPPRARRLGRLARLGRWARRHPTVAGLLAAVAVTLLAGTAISTYFAARAAKEAVAAGEARDQAREAEAKAVESDHAARRQAAGLLLDRGVNLAGKGEVAEALHWMLAALRTSPDPEFQRLARTHLATWGQRADTIQCWVHTRHPAAILSPDGRRLAAGGITGGSPSERLASLQFWDARDGRAEGDLLRTRDIGMQSLSFSPDGRFLLSVNGVEQLYQGKPGWASRYDVPTRRLLGVSPGPAGITDSAVWAWASPRFTVGDCSLALWVATIAGHSSTVPAAAWAPDGKQFVTASWDRTLRRWDTATGRALAGPIALPSSVGFEAHLAFSPDSATVVVVGGRATEVVELATGKVRTIPLPGGSGFRSVAFSPDGKMILLGEGRLGFPSTGTALPWDPVRRTAAGPPRRAASPAASLAFVRDGRVAPFPSTQVSADGSLFTRTSDGVQVWRSARSRSSPNGDLGRLTGLYAAENPLFLTVRFSPDRRRCWIANPGRWAQAYELATGRPVGLPLSYVSGGPNRMALSPDGRWAATEPPGQRYPAATVILDVRTGRPACPPLPHQNSIRARDFSPDGRVLATGGLYHTVDLWDVRTGRPVRPPLHAGHIVVHLAFSPDGSTVAAASYVRQVRIWEVKSGKLLATLGHPEIPYWVIYSPDGTRLLALCPSAAHLWDARTWKRVGAPMAYPPLPEGHAQNLRGVFSRDGKVVLLSGGDGSFRLWDAVTTRPLTAPTPAGEPQRACFAFSPDGRLVVAGHEDGTAQVWEVASGRPLGAPAVCTGRVHGVTFAADGRSFWTVAGSGSIRSWSVPEPFEGDIERLARSLRLATGLRTDELGAVVPLTQAQWQQERQQWRRSEGDRPWGLARPVADADWHEARACDAEETGNVFTARWHLDRLIALRPSNWLLHARRARTLTEEDLPEQAAVYYRRAHDLGAGKALIEWYRNRAWVCRSRGQWKSALWYLDRLLEEQPDDSTLQPQRAAAAEQLRRQARKP